MVRLILHRYCDGQLFIFPAYVELFYLCAVPNVTLTLKSAIDGNFLADFVQMKCCHTRVAHPHLAYSWITHIHILLKNFIHSAVTNVNLKNKQKMIKDFLFGRSWNTENYITKNQRKNIGCVWSYDIIVWPSVIWNIDKL